MACEDLLQESDTGIASPLTVTAVAGDDQVGQPGATLPIPLEVRLADLHAQSVARLRVEWSVIEGSGTMSPRNTFTDDGGLTEASWTLGPEAGRQAVEARVGKGIATFEATAR